MRLNAQAENGGSSGSRYEVNKVQMVQGMSQQGSIGIRFELS